MKLLLLACLAVLPIVASAQRTYTIMMWNPHILDLRVPVRNGLGLYRNGGQQYGGGKISISKSSFAITLERGAARPDVVKPVTRVEATPEKTTYYSGTSRLVVFKSELDTDRMVSQQQVQYDADWDASVKLHVRRTLFLTTAPFTSTERIEAEKKRQRELLSTRAAKKAEVEEQIKNGHVFPYSDLSTCYRFTGLPQELLAFYAKAKPRRFSAPLVIDETGAVTAKNPNYTNFDEATLGALLRFTPGRIAVGRDTFTVKSATTMDFAATNVNTPEVLVATFTIKKGRRLEVTSDASSELQAKVLGLVNMERLFSDRSNGAYELQYLEQKVAVEITVHGPQDNDCESILVAKQEVNKPVLKYRRTDSYDGWHTAL